MRGAAQALATLRDFVERSTHWREGGATRHDALYVGLPALEDTVLGAVMELTAALSYADRVRTTKKTDVSYETYQRARFRRRGGWGRDYTLADARKDADTACIRLRNAWELLDPATAEAEAEARRTALANCQTQLSAAIRHLQAVLEPPRTAAEQQAADTAAREWLASIGSEPGLPPV